MTTPLWRTARVDDALARSIATTHQLPHRVAKWLCIRNIPKERIATWLRPESSEWLSPAVFWDMDAAVDRLLTAAAAGERVCIVGDYDVDGVTASAILATTLEALGITWSCLIPHRVEDGYGLSKRLVDQAYALGSTMLVTVDNGIRAHEAIDYAVSLGMDVVLTDHHEPGDTLPESALVTLHWARADGSEVRTLSGAGVARKLAEALLRRGVQGTGAIPLLNWHTGLAALGALADMMPMSVENRKLVKEGLSFLRQCEHPGWRALCHVARVDAQTLSETAVLWSITPRLNAAGRMGTAMVALDLLMSKTDEEAAPLAERIEAWNRERKDDTERVYQEALEQHQALDPSGTSPVIVVSGAWNLGVAGIAAARLVNATGRPALVFADDGTGLLRGSGRASDGFPLHEVVTQCKDYLVHFGGHEAAIGCAVDKANLEKFRAALCAAAKSYHKDSADSTRCSGCRRLLAAWRSDAGDLGVGGTVCAARPGQSATDVLRRSGDGGSGHADGKREARTDSRTGRKTGVRLGLVSSARGCGALATGMDGVCSCFTRAKHLEGEDLCTTAGDRCVSSPETVVAARTWILVPFAARAPQTDAARGCLFGTGAQCGGGENRARDICRTGVCRTDRERVSCC